MHTAPRERLFGSTEDKYDFASLPRLVRQRKMEFYRSSDGDYLKLELQSGFTVPCQIFQWEAASLERCESCDCPPETLYALPCGHAICTPCLFAGEVHICRLCTCHAETSKVAESPPAQNKALLSLILLCPICQDPKGFLAMKQHISLDHGKWLSLEQKEPGIVEKWPTNVEYSHSCGAGAVTSANKEAEPASQKCVYCFEVWSMEDITGHVAQCTKRGPPSRECGAVTTANGKSMERHESFRDDQKPKEEGQHPTQGTTTKEEEFQRREHIEQEVQMLKETIMRLEQRIERLEMPLRKIIVELREKKEHRGYKN